MNDSANNFGKIRIIEYKTTASFIEDVLFLSNSFIVFIFEASDKTWNIPNEIQLREKERWVCYVRPYPHCSDWIIGTDVKTTGPSYDRRLSRVFSYDDYQWKMPSNAGEFSKYRPFVGTFSYNVTWAIFIMIFRFSIYKYVIKANKILTQKSFKSETFG